MIWYHGTSKNKMTEILADDFVAQSGTWGDGVYFSSSKMVYYYLVNQYSKLTFLNPKLGISFLDNWRKNTRLKMIGRG